MEKSSWTDGVRIEKGLKRVKEDKNALQTIKTRKAHWIGHILRRNCLLKQVTERNIEGWIEVTERRERRCTQLLSDLKEKTGYCKLKEEAVYRTVLKGHFGRDCGPVVRHARELNKYHVAWDSSEN